MKKAAFEFKVVTVTLLRPGAARDKKKAFTKKLKKEFKQSVSEMTGKKLKWYDIHHIVPVELGGSPTDFKNLAPVKPKLHKKIHHAIDIQVRGMRHGESRRIHLPIMPNALVWR